MLADSPCAPLAAPASIDVTRTSREPVEVSTVFSDKEHPENVVVFGQGSYIW